MWCQDEAGPYQAIPQAGQSWRPKGQPVRQPHEYVRGGTAKLLTLFRPATGEVRGKGVTNAPNVVLHPWLQNELLEVLADLPDLPMRESEPPTATQWNDLAGTRTTLALAAAPHDPHLGQSGRSLELVDRDLVVRSRCDAAVHATEWILAEHG